MTKMKKVTALVLSAILLVTASVAATVAYLTDETADVVNTFTVGNIDIELKEHDYDPDTKTLLQGTENEVISESDYKIIPGIDLPKDPFVRVKAGSEACYVFVKVEKTNWTLADVTYTVDNTIWTPLDGVNGVYWKAVDSLVGATEDTILNVLKDKTVLVSEDLTKEEIETLDKNEDGVIGTDELPKLTFTAYAVQSANGDSTFTAAQAWALI